MAEYSADTQPREVPPVAPDARGLRLRGLTLELGAKGAAKQILRGIDLDIPAGSITGLAGESGSGKTMTGLAICGLQPAGSRLGGTISYTGPRGSAPNLLALKPRAMNALRGREVAMIFQDPTASLHPMMTIEGQLTDGMRHHLKVSRTEARSRALALLERVKVPEPATALKKYPHQFSGGQLQRISIAIALSSEPSVLIADEPTTALDVTVQAGILRLLRELCDSLDLAVLLVTHDLGVMSALADTVTVMRYGEVVEHGTRYQVIREPRSEYTRALIDALPHPPAEEGSTPAPGALPPTPTRTDLR
ncbi:ABC transporter ATP-binding protein [Subtercola boreus]|uniref:Dipeptide/oligopeptide/nickel ABC transporter ATP-binding protein n=1 Tax=Subtercola boreus TaxID=120213 RepID=A0A3E0WDA0_9MICO|nr:ABC transporter ATP-binding protein [Subtercola boreus]RFA22790.1 dipeptide/oligopeptide/nickel ABC transporter ATP-binding protein [Subtercola boreus]RFA23145.1 dipeptide/oligopeptide/nickel ABC transporter ATP-binding protein [Subtercola boreus]RFA28898.1 dipeptide/oligopeptide/nickel ABC transporter ATP-binding protein [Subtercola boreus]